MKKLTDKQKITKLRQAVKEVIEWAEMLDKPRTDLSSMVANAKQTLKDSK